MLDVEAGCDDNFHEGQCLCCCHGREGPSSKLCVLLRGKDEWVNICIYSCNNNYSAMSCLFVTVIHVYSQLHCESSLTQCYLLGIFCVLM